MDNKALHDQFRHQLTNAHALTVLTVSFFEIIGYITLVLSEIETFSLDSFYLWYGVVAPITINTVTHLVARAFVNNPAVNEKSKNKSIITAALITSLVVAVIHRDYIVASCAFIFPIILSAMFNDKKLLNTSFVASVIILFCVATAFWLDNAITLTTALNLFVLFGFAFISYLCGIISINFSAQNYNTIESQSKENDKLMEDTRKDLMTGLYNHAAFTADLTEAVSAGPSVAPLCLVMIDVDDFKTVNDTYGHDCGDEVLIFLAEILQNHCTKVDTAFRYGGEEFAVLFLKKDLMAVTGMLQHILEEFRAHRFSFTEQKITFSAGVAQYVPGLTADAFFEQADQTLYQAKRAGKNRILQAKKATLAR